jgi:DNA-directed RNA polymerase subunit M/transcription elongation factor TFIIS
MRAQISSTADIYNRNSKQQELTKTTQTAVSNRSPHQQSNTHKAEKTAPKKKRKTAAVPLHQRQTRRQENMMTDLQLTQQL